MAAVFPSIKNFNSSDFLIIFFMQIKALAKVDWVADAAVVVISPGIGKRSGLVVSVGVCAFS